MRGGLEYPRLRCTIRKMWSVTPTAVSLIVELLFVVLERRFGAIATLFEQVRHDCGNVRPLVTHPTTDECGMPLPLPHKNP